MTTMTEAERIRAAVAEMAQRGVPITPARVAQALNHARPTATYAENIRAIKRTCVAAEDALAGLTGAPARVAEVEAELVKHGLLGYVDDATGRVGMVYVPPAPAPGKRAEPNSSEGAVPEQQSSQDELNELKREASRLQAIIDAPSALAVEKQRAQALLDPILTRITVLDLSLRPTTGTQYAKPDPYWRKPAKEG